MSQQSASQSPSADLVAISKSDTVFISSGSTTYDGRSTRGIYVGGAGDISVLTENDQTVTLTGVLAGVIYPIRVKRVNSTSTTATNMVALF